MLVNRPFPPAAHRQRLFDIMLLRNQTTGNTRIIFSNPVAGVQWTRLDYSCVLQGGGLLVFVVFFLCFFFNRSICLTEVSAPQIKAKKRLLRWRGKKTPKNPNLISTNQTLKIFGKMGKKKNIKNSLLVNLSSQHFMHKLPSQARRSFHVAGPNRGSTATRPPPWRPPQRFPPDPARLLAEVESSPSYKMYIQTREGLPIYTGTYVQPPYSFFLATVSSTPGMRKPPFVPLSLLEEEDKRDFLEASDTPLPCTFPSSSSLPVTS